MIEALENLLVAALVVAHTESKVVVEPYPRPVESYVLKSEAAILVHYAGAEFDAAEESDIVQQVMLCSFQVVIVSRNLRSHAGAYELMDTNRDAVVGMDAKGLPFFSVSEGILGLENGVWWYSQIFSVRQVYNGVIER